MLSDLKSKVPLQIGGFSVSDSLPEVKESNSEVGNPKNTWYSFSRQTKPEMYFDNPKIAPESVCFLGRKTAASSAQ
jgi:hypothetical protein